MSATNRGTERNVNDFYPTPDWCIQEFLAHLFLVEQPLSNWLICDPSCGQRPYGNNLRHFGFRNLIELDIDVAQRPDFLIDFTSQNLWFKPQMIITNPPYNLASEFLRRAMFEVAPGGLVVFLLRLNFFGSQKRKPLFDEFPPKYCFVHSKRPSFTGGGTDATEYAHFVWQQGYKGFTSTKVI